MILPSPLYVVCDAEVCTRQRWSLIDFASACIDGGARLLQIRAKTLSSVMLFEAASAIIERAAASNAVVVINDRADIAAIAGAAGIHVGQEDLMPAQVRRIAGTDVIVGFSTHTSDQIRLAMNEPIDYVAVGPVFGTVTKDTGYGAVGLSRVTEASESASKSGRRLPVVGIGGITLSNARSVIEAGASSVAVISDLFVGGNPSTRVEEFLRRLN